MCEAMELLHSLRRMEFPECARVALDHLATSSAHSNTPIPGLGAADDFADQLVADFIFGLSNKPPRLPRVCNHVARVLGLSILLLLLLLLLNLYFA